MDTVIYNNHDLSEVIKINEVIRPVGNERDVTTNDAPFLGVNVQEVRTGPKKIKVKFTVQKKTARDTELAKHTLATILNTDKPVRIDISDEPDKYYMGLVIGSVDVDNVARWLQKGEFEILVPDGVAHGTTYRRFDNGQEQPDKVVFNLVNNGNVPAFPVVTVKNNAENGYIGLVNTSGAFEVGDREEADTGIVKKSEILMDFRGDKISTGFSQALKNQGVTNDNTEYVVGTAERINLWERPHIKLKNLRGETKLQNYAASLTWTIPNDSVGEIGSLNDYLWWRQVFWSEALNQYGFIKITISDTNDKFLYGVESFKRSLGSECEYNFFASDGKGSYNILKRWEFDGSTTGDINPFSVARGWSDLKRNDDKVQVFYRGSYFTFTVPEIKGRKSAKIHVTLGAYRDYPMVSHMYLDELYYRKDFVPGIGDVPNRYPIGSNVVLNSENDTVTVDGLEKIVDVVDGSSFLTIPPGNSQLEVYCSSWVKTKPTVKVEFKERYL
ncbi:MULTISPECIES: distal tail protein Dit [Streptococcus]|jgi:putative phage tail component, N-terminal domain protein|uniref:distal tail protein Dit n=1 Tax=Streptococcus TaxID=1301 RepID=UPI000A116C0A|nr:MULTISPECIES: distal tail protein Dit [Streptococcus]QBX17224.1 capsid and scaffold protein [Streptococcus phage Javan345]DAK20418.1 MAG TPA: distal tail protein [Caudoviricetes sp.]MDO6346553.1 phage tail family protein [Streptococcus sp. GP0011]ORO56497.1 phage tail protein [Streptococcus oralis subsp. oralis]DAT10269.1 MAG TPA: distal tail protein [Caudoviricetes sp.]